MTPAGTLGALKGTLAHLDAEAVTRLKLKQVGWLAGGTGGPDGCAYETVTLVGVDLWYLGYLP